MQYICFLLSTFPPVESYFCQKLSLPSPAFPWLWAGREYPSWCCVVNGGLVLAWLVSTQYRDEVHHDPGLSWLPDLAEGGGEDQWETPAGQTTPGATVSLR